MVHQEDALLTNVAVMRSSWLYLVTRFAHFSEKWSCVVNCLVAIAKKLLHSRCETLESVVVIDLFLYTFSIGSVLLNVTHSFDFLQLLW